RLRLGPRRKNRRTSLRCYNRACCTVIRLAAACHHLLTLHPVLKAVEHSGACGGYDRGADVDAPSLLRGLARHGEGRCGVQLHWPLSESPHIARPVKPTFIGPETVKSAEAPAIAGDSEDARSRAAAATARDDRRGHHRAAERIFPAQLAVRAR